MSARIKAILKATEPFHNFALLIVFIVGAIFGAHAWINKAARDAVLDEKFLAELAGRVRPTCIFNTRGTIEADFGVSDYIEDLRVEPNPTNYSFTIYLKAKQHLAYAPLISAIDVDLFVDTATRGKLHDWALVMSPNRSVPTITWGEGGMDTNKVYRFKLEILH